MNKALFPWLAEAAGSLKTVGVLIPRGSDDDDDEDDDDRDKDENDDTDEDEDDGYSE